MGGYSVFFLKYNFFISPVKATFSDLPSEQSEDLSPVTNAIHHALFSVKPRRAYRLHCTFWYVMSLMPGWLNTWYFAMSPPDAVTRS